jgi:O-antigen ligase
MPALFGLYAIRYFPLVKDLKKLHTSACILSVGLGITGLIEVVMGIDLFPWSGAAPLFTDTHVRRADGPFEQQIVLSMVATITFFLVIYLRKLMPRRISPRRALLHKAGSLASFVAALLPLNRGLVLVLVPIAVIDSSSKYRLISRRAWLAFFTTILLAVIAARLLDPRLYDDRVSNPNNAYQRVAQQLETLRVVRQYPFFGVGFGLYYDVVSQDPLHTVKWKGIESMTLPHNVPMTVLSEEGLIGLLLYVSAQVFLIRAMWKIRKAYPPGWLAFLYCILIYTLTGLDFATVYYSDINLLYIFVLGALLQMQTRVVFEHQFAIDRS